MNPLDRKVDEYVAALANARDGFLRVHAALVAAHPGWEAGKDARLNLVAKPVNLILTAIANMRVTQHAVAHPQFWQQTIAPELNTEATIAGPLFELQTFYRFGFFQFLMASVEHGLRAIQRTVVDGVDKQADQPFWKVYTTLFRAALPLEAANRHINLFAFLAVLRNTIHNNGVYYPLKHENATFMVGGKTYEFRDGEIVRVFGWEYFIEWLDYVREALEDLLNAPAVAAPREIPDIATFPIPITV